MYVINRRRSNAQKNNTRRGNSVKEYERPEVFVPAQEEPFESFSMGKDINIISFLHTEFFRRDDIMPLCSEPLYCGKVNVMIGQEAHYIVSRCISSLRTRSRA